MRLLHPPSIYPLGIDISDSSIKIIQLNKTRRLPTLQAAAVAELPEGFVVEGIIKNKIGVADQLKNARQKPLFGKFSSRESIIALPEQKTFTKVITIDAAAGDTARLITTALEKELPYALDEVAYDWQIIKTHKRSREVIVSAAPRQLVQSYRDVCLNAEYEPIALEPEALAIARAILPLHNQSDKTCVILDIGARYSSLIACLNTAVLYTAGIPFSGYALSKKIAKELKMPLQKAESAKIVAGLNNRYLHDTLAEMLQHKVRDALRYLHMHYPAHSAIETLYVCGGGAALRGIAERISETLQLPAVLGDIFTNVNAKSAAARACFVREYTTDEPSAERKSVKQSMAGRFTTAIGAALRGVTHPEI